MKILVTGGAGFIGSAVVRHIIRDTEDSVINLDKLTYAGNLESLPMYRQASVMRLSRWISATVPSWIGCLPCTSRMP